MGGKYLGNTSNKFLNLPNTTVGTYNLHDVHSTAHLVRPLFDDIQEHKPQWDFYLNWIEPLQRAVIAMQRRGMLLDRYALRNYRLDLRRELRAIDNDIRDVADAQGFTYTGKFPNSDPQVAKFLFGSLGLKPAGKTDTGRPSVDQENLTRVLRDLRKKDEPWRQVLYDLLHRSRLQTIYERYLTLTPDSDDRVRSRVKLTGTKTWRFAYEEPPLQQFPKECRHIFRAAPGKVFIFCDYKQLEARILAVLANDEVSLNIFANPDDDIHRANTLDLLNWTIEHWNDQNDAIREAARNFGKAFLYGLQYGGKAETMKTKTFCPCPRCADKVPQMLELKRDQLKAAERRWFRAHPAVKVFQEQLAKDAQANHYYDSPFGLRRWLSKPWGAELDRELKNIPEQMNAALLMNQSQVKMERYSIPIIIQMHDELGAEVPERDADQVRADMQGIMEQAIPELGGYSFPTDAAVGYNWGKRTESNPDGLVDV